MAERVDTAIANALATTATSTYTLRYHFIGHNLIARITKFAHRSCSALTRVLLYFIALVTPAFGQISEGAAPRSYSLSDVLTLSAFGKTETPFTRLSIWNFGDGWLEPWIPPPNGELHLQRGGWVNTASGFFSREIDPAFTFNAGTSGTRDEYIGATSLFVPFNRRFQLGLFVPFVDSLQHTGNLGSATTFGDVVVTPQVMLEETETLSLSALFGYSDADRRN
jgi:hypothetical protein